MTAFPNLSAYSPPPRREFGYVLFGRIIERRARSSRDTGLRTHGAA
jgi:hypothetical protein